MSARHIPHVDHRDPLHDQWCRCRACKPPLVGEERDFRAQVLVYGCAVVLIGIVAGHFA